MIIFFLFREYGETIMNLTASIAHDMTHGYDHDNDNNNTAKAFSEQQKTFDAIHGCSY